jgi:DNA repair photolyase
MTLNKAKGRMFKSVGWTWNPIVGCTHACPYCWAKSLRSRWGKDFEPTLRENFLNDKLPNDDSWIFVGSMGDLFCDGFSDTQIGKVLKVINDYSGSCKFLLQTKNPRRFMSLHNFGWLEMSKDKIILGTTIETNRHTFGRAPSTEERALDMIRLKWGDYKTFLSLEPLADFDVGIRPEAIEIGLENYTKFLPKPTEEKIIELIEYIQDLEIPYVLKENLRHLGGEKI